MAELLEMYAPKTGLCYDIGSYNVNGTYRALVEGRGIRYLGIDIQPGPNVDMVVPELGDYESVVSRRADLVISGQCLEHVKRPWVWIRQVTSVLRRGGLLIVIAPWKWQIHRYPVDCWRILPDGMQALFEFAAINVVEIGTRHNDCFGVGQLSEPESKGPGPSPIAREGS